MAKNSQKRFSSEILNLRTASVVILSALSFAACSLEAPKQTNVLRIVLEDQDTPSSTLFTRLYNTTSMYSVTTEPTSASQFTCFGVNITGIGIGPDVRMFNDCTSLNNFNGKGLGVFSRPFNRGGTVEVDVPSGPNRSIDVYGVYPPLPECGGSSGQNSIGYYLGGVVKSLSENTTVTVPITFTSASTNSKVTCNGNTTYKYFAYVAGSSQIKALEFNSTSGSFTDIATYAAAGIQKIQISANGALLYGSDAGSNILGYRINSTTGTLTSLTNGSWSGTVSKFLIAPARDYLYGAATQMTAAPINSTTGDIGTSLYISSGVTGLQALAIRNDGAKAWAATATTINTYTIDLNSGAWLYQAQRNVSPYSIVSMVTTSNNNYLYSASNTSVLIATQPDNSSSGMVDVSTAGNYTLLSGLTTALAIDPSDRFLYDLHSGGIGGFTIATNGRLTAISSALETTNVGNAVAGQVDTTGNYLFFVNQSANIIGIKNINQTTGAISGSATHPTQSSPTDFKFIRIQQ